MSNLLLQKIVLLRVTEVGKIIQKKKRPLLLARSVLGLCAYFSVTTVSVQNTPKWHVALGKLINLLETK